jgi:hypothetical protein
MLRCWAIMIGLVGIGLMPNGCTKCGPIWEDWLQPQKSCRSDHL